ncbi:caveolae-associated protein 4b [Periophthalmus magnuspinnatus]|uniref:caveolae-associated protein 4b n=1 Tax=Periophthalmus magnuspinnatus TaxID=409849 RepID=UPI00145BF1BC|nr:caveolae-associated protein 4b [Periophthalmus magnuspinnatus]
MADKAAGGDEAGGVMVLLERIAALVDGVQAAQSRMEERQTELENTVKSIQSDVIKLTNEHANSSATVTRLLEKTRKVSRHIKDVRVRVESQNLRVKKVEATQGDLLAKNKFRVVIYQGDQELKSVAAGSEPVEGGAAAPPPRHVEPDKFDLPPESDEEYMVVEEADSSAAARMKKSGLTRIESIKHTFSKENLSKTRENLGSKVNKLGERIVTAERREKIRQSGERLKEKLTLKKERTVAEGQEGAEGAADTAQPVAPPKGRKGTPEAAAGEGKAEEAEVPIYDMKQLS